MSKISYIDLFAGGGGLSEGFIEQGFKPLAHVESDEAATYTLKTRAAYHYLKNSCELEIYNAYLRGEVSRTTLYSAVPKPELDSIIHEKIGDRNKEIFDRIDGLVGGAKVDLIVGGPPCQAYSLVGRAPLKHRTEDERTKLYIQYGRFLKRYQPKAFLFENVPGILSARGGQYFKNLTKYYKRLGYEVEAKLFNARDFGVIQSRKRVIIIGWKTELNWQYPEVLTSKLANTRDDIFLDLPAIRPGESQSIQKYATPSNPYLELTGIRNCVDFVSQHVARPHNERDLKIYQLAIEQLENGCRLKNSDVPESMRTQKNVTSFLDRFKVVGEIPHTMIAHIAKDGHHFIHPDKAQLRSISIREAARIQSFPDNYFFEGTNERQSRSAAFRQVGNAVPPLMASKFAAKMKELLQNEP
jgi:DNA (cytosine-5)-methyltransferase 1